MRPVLMCRDECAFFLVVCILTFVAGLAAPVPHLVMSAVLFRLAMSHSVTEILLLATCLVGEINIVSREGFVSSSQLLCEEMN